MALKILGGIVLAWCILAALAWFFQRSLIYFPSRESPPAWAFPPGGEKVSFDTRDGLRLSGWFRKPDGTPSGITVIVFNGNAGDRSLRVPLAERLAGAGHGTLLFDYRGFGGNPGRPSEEGLAEDARAAHEYLLRRRDVDPARIVYFGESLGTGVAIALAGEHPPLALVLRSPFTSLADVGQWHLPILPVRWLISDRFDSARRIAGTGCPLLVIAGDKDRVVPFRESRKLFDAAREPKRFVAIPGADHNDEALLDGETMTREILCFLDEVGRDRS